MSVELLTPHGPGPARAVFPHKVQCHVSAAAAHGSDTQWDLLEEQSSSSWRKGRRKIFSHLHRLESSSGGMSRAVKAGLLTVSFNKLQQEHSLELWDQQNLPSTSLSYPLWLEPKQREVFSEHREQVLLSEQVGGGAVCWSICSSIWGTL